MKLRLDFFNNKRLLVILSGVACILIALLIFVVSLIGFGNIGAFFGGKPAVTKAPENTPTNVPTGAPAGTPTPTQGGFYTPDIPLVTPPVSDMPGFTTPPVTEIPTEIPTEMPTETPTPTDVPVTGITIREGLSYTLTVGSTVQLNAVVMPVNATVQTIDWSSSNKSIATVDKDGFVAALSAGEANITARSGNAFAQIKITVKAATVAVDGVIFDIANTTLKVGESVDLTNHYKVSPSNATETQATWKSSDNNVVTVVNGKVTAVGAGTADITVTVGGKSATTKITVEAEPTPTPDEPTPTPDQSGVEPTDPATVGDLTE